MDNMNRSVGKVLLGVPFTFTFVPVLRKIPSETAITVPEDSGPSSASQNLSVSREKASGETMSTGDIFKVETVFIADPVEGGAGKVPQPKITNQLQPQQDHVSAPESGSCPLVAAQAENMASRVAAGKTFMETAVGKHGRVSQQRGPDAAGLPEVSSGFFVNRTSPTDSADSLTPTASSRESLLSEELDKERGWRMEPSSVTSPASLSRTVSPCSSVLSGIFSPAVVQIRKHFLAPGSSLIHTPQTCFSSCESLSSSCPQSPPPRRRPPLTRLSLLTAILRKGRLPVLSPAVQRPYTPCWPINPVTLSFCNACSAASSVASIPLELSSQFPSTVSIDSQSHIQREPHRRTTAPVPSNEPAAACFKHEQKLGGCSITSASFAARGGSSHSDRIAKTSEGSHKAPRLPPPPTHTPVPHAGCRPSGLPRLRPLPLHPTESSACPLLSPCAPHPPRGRRVEYQTTVTGRVKKRKTHKIKLSYKSLAAIPTNTLLLDQQVIDEQVERGDNLCGAVDKGVLDTHAEMCSPAQFRQQSAELYAVIDEILADSIPVTPQHSRTPTPIPGLQAKQKNSSSSKSLGRETKYATLCSLHPSNTVDRNQLGAKQMKPGIIRPMTAIPRLRVEDDEGCQRDAFGQFDMKGSSGDSTKAEAEKDFYTLSTRRGLRDTWRTDRKSPSTAWDLQITES